MLDLEAVDVDGAIRETQDEAMTRSSAFRRAVAFGGGLFGGATLLGLLSPNAFAQSKGDVAILNYALTLEYLEAEFYTQAEARAGLSGELLGFAQVVGQHERSHVAGLREALGSAAVKKPKFNFRGTTENAQDFAATAQLLEDTGVAAYKGQAAAIRSNAVLTAALAIHAVEARHAAWIRDINGAPPAPAAFDEALSMKQVLSAVAKTRFIVA
ncbi:ferritin-like domain-containing protein [Solirubrobacter sp. CPCC 204708]|uniref:Ferritin-like domain-containing protein n=1 Tax=Solirubrobacter deserti TaxID=2282478 RepID=A0ABT4RDL5_9ACTN|nr:ferritin-like domain-containing protein [Solirubrobacter deserti]MBE2314621.1 ferritin-like domain-containing protein [Solirubrobacter deserti]MDA0136628.1 ferritin-like domain-containing protein [Solirubrobacter deserti]